MQKLKFVETDGINAIFSNAEGSLISFSLAEKPKLKQQISMKNIMKRPDGSDSDFYLNGYYDEHGVFVVHNSEFDNAF